MKHLALALVVFACKDSTSKSQPPPAPPTPPAASARAEACTRALASFDRFVDTGEPGSPEQRAQIKAALVARCVADAWSDVALTCMRAAQTSHEIFQCWNAQLTQPQREAAARALGQLEGATGSAGPTGG